MSRPRRVQALTIVARITPGHEAALRDVLSDVAAEPASNQYIRLSESPRTHLANWVIVTDPDNGPRLFFASNHDGDTASYLQELVRVGPGLEQIFGHCEGFEGIAALPQFVARNSYRSQTFFAGFPLETVAAINDKIALRQRIEEFLGDGDPSVIGSERWRRFLETLGPDKPPEPPSAVVRVLQRVGAWLHARFFAVVIAAARWYGRRRVDDHDVSVAADLDQPDIAADLSDADHMTNMIDVKPRCRLLLRPSLAIMQFLARYAFPPGSLAGVTTIRFARWVLVDDGRRLLFQSRFDGTWENYMGDFVDKIDWGLDAIWANTVGYPSAGMKDIDAFKRFIRERQFEHLAVYEAHPDETVLNLMRDRAIADGVPAHTQAPSRAWLQAI
jgi:hypothetical protein